MEDRAYKLTQAIAGKTGYSPGHLPADYPTTAIKSDLRALARAYGLTGACVSDGTVTTDDLRAIYNGGPSAVAAIQARIGYETTFKSVDMVAMDDPAPEPETADAEAPALVLPELEPRIATMLDTVLATAKLPPLAAIKSELGRLSSELATAKALASAASALAKVIPPSASGELPEGEIKLARACDLFGFKGKAEEELFAFDVPCFQWEFPHPDVPEIDPAYIFRLDALTTLLLAIKKGQQPWVHGHTGSGKSTLMEQIAARLGWPCKRVNFDSEITRMDLVGRDTLIVDPASGKTVTKWEDGILPQALRGPYILLLDEVDFVRPDVAYVMQRIAEGKGLLLNENGGEYVKPHPMFRLVATANTVGQGDEFGMYQGARPQSMAFLDRFFPFVHVPYLDEAREVELIRKRVPSLAKPVAQKIGRYVTEHRQAFANAQVMQPISPRGICAVADAFVSFFAIYNDEKTALAQAFNDMILAKATQQDRAVLKGLLDRVIK